jgi:ribosomal protein L29
LKDRLAAKKAAVASSSDSAKPEAKPAAMASPTTSAPSVATAQAVNVGIDPAAMNELKAEIASLKKELAQVKSGLDKTVKDGHAALKKELQRSEGNAKSFQDNAVKKIENIDKTTANEVRRIREKTREAISNDTGRLQEALFALKGSVTATLVLNILTLVLVFMMMMKTF